MLFAISWTPRPGLDEEREKRTLQLFSKWEPPAGVEFQGFYDYADGDGGIAIVEAASAAALLETTAPWTAYFEFSSRPVVTAQEGAEIFGKATAWRDSIG